MSFGDKDKIEAFNKALYAEEMKKTYICIYIDSNDHTECKIIDGPAPSKLEDVKKLWVAYNYPDELDKRSQKLLEVREEVRILNSIPGITEGVFDRI